MAVVIRLARLGRTHRPYYRVVAIDQRHHREGRAAQVLGTYDPLLSEKNVKVDIEAIHSLVLQGAQLSEAVANLLRFGGYEALPKAVLESQAKKQAKAKAGRVSRAKKDGTKWQKPSRRALAKHAKKVKAERVAQQQEALAAHKAKAEAEAAAAESSESSEESPAENAEG